MAQYDKCIHYHINGYHLKQYMQERKKWDDNTWNMIDFGSFGQHFKRLAPAQQIRHMKLVHDQLPLGKRRHIISQSKDEALKKCPCCMDADEDSHHLLRCQLDPFMTPGLLSLHRFHTEGSHIFDRILVDGIQH